MFAMRTFNSSYADVDKMELDILLDFIGVYEKINDAPADKKKGKSYTVLD